MLHGIKHFTLNYINSLQVAELKQEAGKISNLELQRKVVRVFYYLCVVTLQYTAPMILILYLCFLYKTLGGGSWTGGFTPATFSESGGQAAAAGAELDSEFQEVEVADTREMDIGIGTIIQQEESVEAIKHQFSLAWISVKNVRNSFCSKIFHFLSCIQKKNLQVFTTEVFRGLLGFSTWWCCFVWFSSAAIGVGYQSYFYKV